MAGHSQFKNIMYRKGAQDKKRAKIFNRIAREITVAVKESGPDMGSNPRLRAAILNGRAENMPKDKIENAIKKGSGTLDADNLHEIRYEGYGPGGAAIIVETMTNNKNRTAADIRSIFTKNGGNMGETGSVGFMFDRVGQITYPASVASEEAMLEAAIEAGADDCQSDAESHRITCAQTSYGAVREAIEKKFGEATNTKLAWLPKSTTPVGEDQASGLLKLIETLEDNDDVQEVSANFEIEESVLQKLSA